MVYRDATRQAKGLYRLKHVGALWIGLTYLSRYNSDWFCHKITAGSRRVEFQNNLTAKEYVAVMNDNIEDLTELRVWSLEKIKENKSKVARAYNKKVKPKEFQVGDLVCEAVLPLGTKDAAYGKWSPNWHGPYRVDQVLPGNAYMLEELDGVKFPVAVNGQHLKRYFPSMWDDGQ
jgi:hypothetical protein